MKYFTFYDLQISWNIFTVLLERFKPWKQKIFASFLIYSMTYQRQVFNLNKAYQYQNLEHPYVHTNA